MQVALYDIASQNAFTSPSTLRANCHDPYLFSLAIVDPHLYYLTFISLNKARKLLDIFENEGFSKLICCRIKNFLALSCQYKIFLWLQRLALLTLLHD